MAGPVRQSSDTHYCLLDFTMGGPADNKAHLSTKSTHINWGLTVVLRNGSPPIGKAVFQNFFLPLKGCHVERSCINFGGAACQVT